MMDITGIRIARDFVINSKFHVINILTLLSSMDKTKKGESHVIHVEEIRKADYVDASYCGVHAGNDTSAEDGE
jgi:hypothetical protein